MSTYYLAHEGIAANKGAATGVAYPDNYMSVGTHNSETFSPGDVIKVSDAGGVIRGSIVQPPTAGTSGSPITYENDGTPIISVGVLVTGWVNHSGNVWKVTSFTRYVNQLWIDDNFGDLKSQLVDLTDEYDWYLDDPADVLYLYSPGGDPDTQYTSPGIEAPWHDRCINVGVEYTVYDGLTIQKASYAGMRATECPGNITIKNCTCEKCGNSGIQVSNQGSSYSNVVIEDNILRWNGMLGIEYIYGGQDGIIRRNTCYEQSKDQQNSANVAGIKLYDGQSTPMSGNVIEYNKCYSNGSQDTSHFQGHCGIWLDDVQGTSSSRNKIRFNLCYDNWGNGIFVEISSYNDVYGNLCYDNAKNSGLNEFMPCNLAVDARSVWKSEYNRIYNNTCVGGKCNVKLATYTRTSPEVNYNEFKNNIFVGASIREGYFNFGGDNDGVFGTGNTYSKNCFGSQSTGFLNWSGTDYNTYGAWLAATPTSGKSDNNVESAPDFNNESSDEYWLASDSPCIDVGLDLGTDYKQALLKESSWPSSVSTGDQDLYGVGWELGAYLFESGTIGCTTGIVTLTGLAADVQAATIVLATTGQVDLTGLAAEIWRSETLDVTKGTVTLAAQNAQVFTATKVQATAGTVTLTALSATLPWQPPLVILAPGRVVLTAYRAKIRRKIQGWKGWKAWGGWRT